MRISPTRKARVVAVGVTIAVAAIVDIALTLLLGGPVHRPAFASGTAPTEVALPAVMLTAAVAGLAGWLTLAALERFTARARTPWTLLAVVVLAGSLAGPMSGTGVTQGDRTALVLLHLAVGVSLMSQLRRTASDDERDPRDEPAAISAPGGAPR